MSEDPAKIGAAALTADRGRTHGEYATMAGVQMSLVATITSAPNWASLPAGSQAFLLATAMKFARILTGDPLEPDHYDDVGGYAHLAAVEVRAIRAKSAPRSAVPDPTRGP